jgi:hypothetical protein
MTEYLRDLLYLDWEKAASIFSQLQGGLLKETQESAEKTRERRAGLGLSIGPLRPEVGGSAADRASVVETRVMHHDLLLTIEDALFRGGAAVDLSSYRTAEEARAAAEQCAYIRTEGWAAIEDNDRIDRMSASFLDVAGMIRRSVKLALEDSAEVQELRAQIEQERKSMDGGPKAQRSAAQRRVREQEAQLEAVLDQLAEAQMPAPTEQTIDDIRLWISVFAPGRILARFYPFEDEPRYHVVAALKRDCFVDADLANLLVAYGTRPTVKLTVFGLVTSVPSDSGEGFDPLSEYPEDDAGGQEAAEIQEEDAETEEQRAADYERVFRMMFRSMEGFELFSRPTRYPRITVFPIAIYRRVPVEVPSS